jgi:hypothetical protein
MERTQDTEYELVDGTRIRIYRKAGGPRSGSWFVATGGSEVPAAVFADSRKAVARRLRREMEAAMIAFVVRQAARAWRGLVAPRARRGEAPAAVQASEAPVRA